MATDPQRVWVVLWTENYGDDTHIAEVFANDADARTYVAARNRQHPGRRDREGAVVYDIEVRTSEVWDRSTGPATQQADDEERLLRAIEDPSTLEGITRPDLERIWDRLDHEALAAWLDEGEYPRLVEMLGEPDPSEANPLTGER